MSGLFRRIRERFARDDEDEKKVEQRQEEQTAEAAVAAPETAGAAAEESAARVDSTVQDIVAQAAAAQRESAAAAPPPETAASPASSESMAATKEGTVAGTGLDRTYVSRAGDTLEAIGAYFYGDPAQKQRLLDDNTWLTAYDGKPLPGGIEIKVGEDPNRGDAVSV